MYIGIERAGGDSFLLQYKCSSLRAAFDTKVFWKEAPPQAPPSATRDSIVDVKKVAAPAPAPGASRAVQTIDAELSPEVI